jgi:Mg-chelatase subunit ChlD
VAVENEQPREIVDEQPSLAVVVIVDRSGSMQGQKLDSARFGAAELAKGLPDDALFAMVAFDSEATTVVKLQPAKNRDRIASDIETLTAGGGTNYFPALREAAEMLSMVQAARKIVVFLSDGEAPYDGVVDVITEMRANGVTTTTVGLAGADRNLLQMMAEAGEGSLFMVEDPAVLARIMAKAIE